MEKNYFLLYQKYKSKYINLKQKLDKEQTGGSSNNKDVYLFKAEWCPHCTSFLPSWEKLKEDYESEYNFITYDSEKNKKEISQWKIQGFPTIIVKKDDEALEYMGPNNYQSVLNFIEKI